MPFDPIGRLVELSAGVYVDEDVLRIVQRILEYDPNLRVKYLDPDRGGEVGDPPYKIFELCPDGIERLVFSVWVLDQHVLERLWAADTQKQNILANIDKNNERARRDRQKRYRDQADEALEITRSIIRSSKDTYTMPGPVEGTRTVFSATEPVKIKTRSGLEVPDESR